MCIGIVLSVLQNTDINNMNNVDTMTMGQLIELLKHRQRYDNLIYCLKIIGEVHIVKLHKCVRNNNYKMGADIAEIVEHSFEGLKKEMHDLTVKYPLILMYSSEYLIRKINEKE